MNHIGLQKGILRSGKDDYPTAIPAEGYRIRLLSRGPEDAANSVSGSTRRIDIMTIIRSYVAVASSPIGIVLKPAVRRVTAWKNEISTMRFSDARLVHMYDRSRWLSTVTDCRTITSADSESTTNSSRNASDERLKRK